MTEYDFPPRFGIEAFQSPATESQLREFEALTNAQLPADYRQFLQRWNGCILKEVAYFSVDGYDEEFDEIGRVARIYGFGSEHPNLNEAENYYQFRQRVPEAFWPIGHWNGYFMVCLQLRGEQHGAIFYWDPGLPYEDGPNVQTRDYLHFVADSFWEFWNILREEYGSP